MSKRKKKEPPVDGLGPADLKRIHKALGQVRRWSYPVRLVKARCLHPDGFVRCENKRCQYKGKPVPAIQVDHIEPIGEIGGPGYLQRMFVPSWALQGLCRQCHKAKTKLEAGAKTKRNCKEKFTDRF